MKSSMFLAVSRSRFSTFTSILGDDSIPVIFFTARLWFSYNYFYDLVWDGFGFWYFKKTSTAYFFNRYFVSGFALGF